jgi:hypothetical protein
MNRTPSRRVILAGGVLALWVAGLAQVPPRVQFWPHQV